MYLYMFQSKDYVRDDCIEEYTVAANTKKEAVKKFREILKENNAILNFKVQVYRPDWWNVYRYPLEKLELMRFGGETTMPCKIWRNAKETAEEVNGKVIELYAREVSEDEKQD